MNQVRVTQKIANTIIVCCQLISVFIPVILFSFFALLCPSIGHENFMVLIWICILNDRLTTSQKKVPHRFTSNPLYHKQVTTAAFRFVSPSLHSDQFAIQRLESAVPEEPIQACFSKRKSFFYKKKHSPKLCLLT